MAPFVNARTSAAIPSRKRLQRARRMGRAAFRNGNRRGKLVARLCHPADARSYEDGYDDARVKAALRYPGTGSGYKGGWF